MPTLTVSPNPALPGSNVQVSGLGFDPKIKVQIALDGAGYTTNYFRPAKDGTFHVGINVSTTPKTQTVTARLATTQAIVATTAVTVANPPPPSTMTVTSSIAGGSTLSGSIQWTATVSGGTATKVDFLIDGAIRWTENAAPYQYNGDPGGLLDTTTLADGPHTLQVVATDAAGNKAAASSAVTISNAITPPPTGGPTVPAGLASGAITLQQAVDQATGGAIGVPPRQFNETVTVGKTLQLIAVGGTPIIDGQGSRTYGLIFNAQNVVVDGFEVRNCTVGVQDGAIRVMQPGGIVRHTKSHDHKNGPGIVMHASTTIEDSEFYNCLQQGIHGSSPGTVVIRRTHVHHNNVAVQAKPPTRADGHGPYLIQAGPYKGWYWPVDPFWEAGASKITRATSVLWEDCEVDHNGGVGIWADIDDHNWTVRRNLVHHNDLSGIMYEISWGTTTIEDNSMYHDGECDHRGWGWPAEILISSSMGPITAQRNTMAYAVKGISVISQNRTIDSLAVNPGMGEGSKHSLLNNIGVLTGNVTGWYTDNGNTWSGRVDTGNVYYGSHTTAADAALSAAGIPLVA